MSRTVQRVVGEVLRQSAAGRRFDASLARALSGLGPAGVDDLLLAASRHGVTGMLGEAVAGDDRLPTGLRQRVDLARSRVVRDHLRAVGELALLADRLDAAAVPWLLCKGPALAAVAYPQPYLREYTDLDVLVPERRLLEALQALRGAGFAVDGPGLGDLKSLGAGEIRLRSPAGVPIDLHWDLVNDPTVRSSFAVAPADELLSRTRLLDVHGTRVLTLGPVDTLLHVAVHACTSGGWRLLWLRDVVQAAGGAEPDADEVLLTSRRWGVDLVLNAMLDRAARVLQMPTRHVGPASRPPWLRLLAVIDRATPVERRTGRPSLIRIVTRSTRRDSCTSGVELLRRSAAFSRSAVRSGGSRGAEDGSRTQAGPERLQPRDRR